MLNHMTGKVIFIVAKHFPEFAHFPATAGVLYVKVNIVLFLWTKNLA